MAGLARRVAVAAVLCAACVAVLGIGQAAAAPASPSPAAQRALDEIANEAGYRNWSAYTTALAAKDQAREKEAWRIIADALTYGRRVEESYGSEGNLRLFQEYVIDFNAGNFYLRTGAEEDDPGFLGFGAKTTRITTYWKGLEPVGTVTTEIQDGVETVTKVSPFVPGGIDLKVGDQQKAPTPSSSAAGVRPRTMDPKKDGSLGTSSGGTAPLAGVLDAIVQADAQQRQQPADQGSGSGQDAGSKPDPGADSGPDPGSDPGADPGADGSKPSSNIKWGETFTSDDGTKYTAYDWTHDDGSKTYGTKTERTDGTTTCHTKTSDGEQESECPSGMTDEPSCTSDCARLTMLAGLFFCAGGGDGGAECGQLPEGAGRSQTCTALVYSGTSPESTDLNEQRSAYDCGEEVDALIDYGDPTDPNGAEPLDWGTFFDPRNDGVTDPVNPGEAEQTLQAGIALDMFGSLRDPAPPGGDEPPTVQPPNPGDAQ
jgi:hypothetical protein